MELLEDLKSQWNITFTGQQRQAVEQLEGPVLLLAVPGAGKTTVLVTRVARLLEQGVPAGAILSITFNKESARDLSRRFEALFGERYREAPRFSTIHSLCYDILRRYGDQQGRPVPILLEGSKAPQTKGRILRELYLEQNGEYPDEEQVRELERLCGYYVNRMERPGPEDDILSAIGHLSEIFVRYQQVKKQNGWMDYDDLLSYALSILRKRPAILEYYRQKYRYIHVDEAQDTSNIQHEIIALLAAEHRNLFLVGDEDQSIYSFRGACPQALLDFGKRYPGGVILKMETNFRSTSTIVETAGKIIARNQLRYPKTMVSSRGAGPAVRNTSLEDGRELPAYLLRSLGDLAPGETAAILYRNNPSSIAVLDYFDRMGQPFYMKGHRSTLRSQSITQDILSIITLYYNPDDLTAFSRIYYKVGAYISRKMYDYVAQTALPGDNLFRVAASSPDATGNSARILMLQYTIAKFGSMSPEKILSSILYDFDYLGFLERCSQGGLFLEQCTQRLRALESIASSTKTLEEFLARMEEIDQIIAQASGQKDCPVTLSTIHSAKGLEYDRVYLIDLQEGLLPAQSAIEAHIGGDSQWLEEERRLFYVALTRAKNQLEVIHCQNLGATRLSVSRFVGELSRPNETLGAIQEQIGPGRRVLHRYFGSGVVSSVDFSAGTMSVRFYKQGEKTLILSALEDETLLRLLPQ